MAEGMENIDSQEQSGSTAAVSRKRASTFGGRKLSGKKIPTPEPQVSTSTLQETESINKDESIHNVNNVASQSPWINHWASVLSIIALLLVLGGVVLIWYVPSFRNIVAPVPPIKTIVADNIHATQTAQPTLTPIPTANAPATAAVLAAKVAADVEATQTAQPTQTPTDTPTPTLEPTSTSNLTATADVIEVTIESRVIASLTAAVTPTPTSFPECEEPQEDCRYQLKALESLSLIAQRVYGGFQYTEPLCQYNDIVDCGNVAEGKELKLPFKSELDARLETPTPNN